jgi:peptide subunit release factor 1 (eRF1)
MEYRPYKNNKVRRFKMTKKYTKESMAMALEYGQVSYLIEDETRDVPSYCNAGFVCKAMFSKERQEKECPDCPCRNDGKGKNIY